MNNMHNKLVNGNHLRAANMWFATLTLPHACSTTAVPLPKRYANQKNMEVSIMSLEGLCSCNLNEFHNLPKPLFRLVCHCKTCQLFFGSSYNDECTFLLKDCKGLSLDRAEFKSYQNGFSPIKRGKCIQCGKPKYCRVKVGPFAEFVSIPSDYIRHIELPQPFAHIYYDSRAAEVKDRFIKIGGHLMSQIAIQYAIFVSILKRVCA